MEIEITGIEFLDCHKKARSAEFKFRVKVKYFLII